MASRMAQARLERSEERAGLARTTRRMVAFEDSVAAVQLPAPELTIKPTPEPRRGRSLSPGRGRSLPPERSRSLSPGLSLRHVDADEIQRRRQHHQDILDICLSELEAVSPEAFAKFEKYRGGVLEKDSDDSHFADSLAYIETIKQVLAQKDGIVSEHLRAQIKGIIAGKIGACAHSPPLMHARSQVA